MEIAYRIAKTQYCGSHDEMFSGTGAAINGGRWNSRGVSMVYASENRSLAALEISVHLNNANALESYSICQISIPDGCYIEAGSGDLPNGWNEMVINPLVAQAWGDLWVSGAASPVVKVPSVVQTQECNYLINPDHPDFAALALGPIAPYTMDPRIKGNPL